MSDYLSKKECELEIESAASSAIILASEETICKYCKTGKIVDVTRGKTTTLVIYTREGTLKGIR